jgi:phosphoribosylglycinamide formyltransferase-1
LSKSYCRTAVLISGSGSNLQSFIDKSAHGEIDLDLSVVFSNKPDAYGLTRAKAAGIATERLEHGNYADRETFDRAVASILDAYEPDLIILAGFMRILSPWFVQHYEGRILNIHPALLPAYPGLDTHQRVLDAGEEWHGSTVHFVTEELDGGPRILQGRLAVDSNETADELCARVQAIEHQIYPQAANWFGQGRLQFHGGQTVFDGKPLDEPVVRDFP